MFFLIKIKDKVDEFTGPYQAAYKEGRSCADLVWAQNLLISVVMKKDFEFSKVNIDMTSAFNTIRRQTTINLLEIAGCSSDDIRLTQYMMANTTLTVKVKSIMSPKFEYNLGAAQGDSLSGKLFTLNLAGALMHVRAVLPSRPNPPIAENSMPTESEYADDAEFLDENPDKLKEVYNVSQSILSEWSLFVNDKTTFTRIYLAPKDELDKWGKPVKGNETWRNEVLLGTKLGSEEDIINRCNKANTAFHSKYKKLWCQGSKRTQITEQRKIRLYESLVTSILLYNCCCWAAPQTVLESVNVLQRKHLRQIIRIFWPNTISNEALYKRCGVTPLTDRINKARWNMLGHVLRSGNCTPAYQALRFAAVGCKNMKGRRGHHRTNSFDIIECDLRLHKLYLQTENDFNNFVDIAQNRKKWVKLFYSKTN